MLGWICNLSWSRRLAFKPTGRDACWRGRWLAMLLLLFLIGRVPHNVELRIRSLRSDTTGCAMINGPCTRGKRV
jgi:hypothetical protein